MDVNQLLSWRPITGPKGKPRCLPNPEIPGGGQLPPPIPTVDVSEVALRRVKHKDYLKKSLVSEQLYWCLSEYFDFRFLTSMNRITKSMVNAHSQQSQAFVHACVLSTAYLSTFKSDMVIDFVNHNLKILTAVL